MPSTLRADHVGSFLRPAELLRARSSQIAPSELEAIENRNILRVLERQKEIGLDVFTDGELRRTNFMSDFTDAVEGFDFGDAVVRQWKDDDEKAQHSAAPVSSINGIVTSTLKQRQPLTGRELPFLKEHAPGPIKMTLPSATQFPAISFKYGITDAVYGDPYALLSAITAIMAEDIRTLATSGISYLQIDAPRYSYYLDPKWTAWMEKLTARRSRADADRVSPRRQCLLRGRPPPRRHSRHPSVPRQQSQSLVRGGGLRCHRRTSLPRIGR